MARKTIDEAGVMSRRAFATAAGIGAAMAAIPGVPTLAGPPTVAPVTAEEIEAKALGAVNPALTYMSLDAFAFFTDQTFNNDGRIYQDVTGVQPLTVPSRMSAALPIPCGSTIHQLNVAYQGQPIMEIWKRSMTTPTPFAPAFQQTVPAGGGPQTATYDFTTPIAVEQGTTVSVRFFASAGASVLGVTVGYLPPAQGFIPFSGGTPRILDTRQAGGKFQATEQRVISLGFPGARGAVLNLTLAETESAGFVGVFPSNIAWPNNSSINWTSANQFVANGAIVAVDSQCRITAIASQRTHLIIDRIGWLI